MDVSSFLKCLRDDIPIEIAVFAALSFYAASDRDRKRVMTIQAENGCTALHKAVMCVNLFPIAKALLHFGMDPNVKTKTGVTPIVVACGKRVLPTIELLLAYGADPHQISQEGLSAMGMSMGHGHYDAIQLLIDAGAVPTAECLMIMLVSALADKKEYDYDKIGEMLSERPPTLFYLIQRELRFRQLCQ